MAEEGLSWTLDLEAKTRGLDVTATQLGALNAIMARSEDLSRALLGEVRMLVDAGGRAGAGHKKHAEGAEKAEGALKRLVHSGMEPFIKRAEQIAEFEFIRRGVDAIIEAPEKVIDLVKELGEEAIATAAKAERMNLSFKLTLGAEEAENVLGWIEKISGKTEFTGENLKVFVNELTRSGVAAKDLDKYLAAAGDLAARGADPSAAIGALARANLTGKIEGRVLRPLGISTRDLAQLDQFRGKTEKQIQKSLEKTAISRDDLLRIIAGPDKILGDKMLEAGKTLSAQLTHLRELPEKYFEKLADSPGLATLKTELGGLLERLDPASPDGQRIFGALENVFKTIGDLMKSFDLAGVVTKGTEALETFTIMFLEAMSIVPGEIGDKAGFALNNMKRRRETTERDVGDRKALAAQGTTPEFEEYSDYADLNAAELSGQLGQVAKMGAMGLDPNMFQKAGENAGAALVKGARGPKGTDSHSPSKKFAEIGEDAADGFTGGFDSDNAFAVPPMRPGAGPAMGGGATMHVDLTIPVHVHSDGTSAREQGAAAGEAASIPIRAEVTRLFEQLQREAGG